MLSGVFALMRRMTRGGRSPVPERGKGDIDRITACIEQAIDLITTDLDLGN
jgi:hypothetical protein